MVLMNIVRWKTPMLIFSTILAFVLLIFMYKGTMLARSHVVKQTSKPPSRITEFKAPSPTSKAPSKITESKAPSPTSKPPSKITESKAPPPTSKAPSKITESKAPSPTSKPPSKISESKAPLAKNPIKSRPTGMTSECDCEFVAKDGSIYIPPQSTLDTLNYEQLKCLYHSYVSNLGFHCKQIIRLGNLRDGGWEVCHDVEYRPKENCLVYSAGIGFDFSFDDQIALKYGCEVHSFDPSMGRSDFQRNKLVSFHNVGLADKNSSADEERGNKWKMRTASSLKNSLGHAKRHIDVFKLDIETWEWKVLPELIKSRFLDNVTTLDLELHMTSNPSPRVWIYELDQNAYLRSLKTLLGLHQLGFRIFCTHRNLACYFKSKEGIERTSCQEVSMVKVRT